MLTKPTLIALVEVTMRLDYWISDDFLRFHLVTHAIAGALSTQLVIRIQGSYFVR
jgi:hypothetical protein